MRFHAVLNVTAFGLVKRVVSERRWFLVFPAVASKAKSLSLDDFTYFGEVGVQSRNQKFISGGGVFLPSLPYLFSFIFPSLSLLSPLFPRHEVTP